VVTSVTKDNVSHKIMYSKCLQYDSECIRVFATARESRPVASVQKHEKKVDASFHKLQIEYRIYIFRKACKNITSCKLKTTICSYFLQ
jgi:hypothetical protein